MEKKEEKPEVGETILKTFGVGLSRLLRYSFGGFLAVVIAAKVEPKSTEEYLNVLGWPLNALAVFIVSVGIYAAHRSLVIPLHHGFGCFLFRVWDRLNGTSEKESLSPTRWFRSLGVKPYRLMLAYNILRRDGTFLDKKEREELSVAHAEFGLVVMMAEGCFLAAAYVHTHRTSQPASWVWVIAGLVLWLASYPGPLQQHAIECSRWRARENTEKTGGVGVVTAVLKKYGLLM